MRDANRYRPNVAFILANAQGRVFLARRAGSEAWQFPQGGVDPCESPQDALYRELREEIGLDSGSVKIIASTRRWLKYRVPEPFRRYSSRQAFVGQRQKWYLLRFLGNPGEIRLDREQSPEFDQWNWVSYWYPLRCIIDFKRQVYGAAMIELAPRLAMDSTC